MNLGAFIQEEEGECGLMAVGAAAALLGREISPRILRQQLPASVRGSSVARLCEFANHLGLHATPISMAASEASALRFPAVLLFNQSHFVVLRKVARGKFHVFDPASGTKVLSAREFDAAFSEAAVEVSLNDSAEPEAMPPTQAWRPLLRHVSRQSSRFAQLAALSLAIQAGALTLPLLSQLAINFGASYGSVSAAGVVLACMALMHVAYTGAEAWRVRVNQDMSSEIDDAIGARLFSSLLAFPLPWFQRRKIADIMSRFDAIEPIRNALGGGVLGLVVDGFLAVVVCIGLLFFSPKLGIVVLAATVAIATYRLMRARELTSLSAELGSARAAEVGKRWETFRGIATLKLYGAEIAQQAAWMSVAGRANAVAQRLHAKQHAIQNLTGLLNNLAAVAVIYVGVRSVGAGELSVGGLFAYVMYRRYLADKTTAAIEALAGLWALSHHAEQISSITAGPHGASTGSRAFTGVALRDGSVRANKLYFRHSAADPLLIERLELAVSSGEMVAVSGPSGCGKSTLLMLLAGVLAPTAGSVEIGQIDVAQLAVSDNRRRIVTVTQDEELFAGSIFDNISMFDASPDHEMVLEALRGAAIFDDVMRLPMGLQTPVGEAGRLLSAGQRQRLFIARALYRRPLLLLLDEATANLDPVSEREVLENLRRHPSTKILVSHSKTVATASDRHLHWSNGALREVSRRVAPPEGAVENA